MYKVLQAKIKAIAEKYADIVDMRIQAEVNKHDVNSVVMMEINDGIRMLNHVAATLERIDRLHRGNDTDSQL